MNLFFEAQFLLSLLALKENQDRVPVTREDQLNMRKKPDGDGRSRRGKGKGRGRAEESPLARQQLRNLQQQAHQSRSKQSARH